MEDWTHLESELAHFGTTAHDTTSAIENASIKRQFCTNAFSEPDKLQDSLMKPEKLTEIQEGTLLITIHKIILIAAIKASCTVTYYITYHSQSHWDLSSIIPAFLSQQWGHEKTYLVLFASFTTLQSASCYIDPGHKKHIWSMYSLRVVSYCLHERAIVGWDFAAACSMLSPVITPVCLTLLQPHGSAPPPVSCRATVLPSAGTWDKASSATAARTQLNDIAGVSQWHQNTSVIPQWHWAHGHLAGFIPQGN